MIFLKRKKKKKSEQQEIQQLRSSIASAISTIEKMESGHFDLTSDDSNDELDILGNSLIRLHNQLKSAREIEYQRTWVNEGLASFSKILSSDQHTLDEISNLILKNLVRQLSANQGAFYVVNEDEETLEQRACFAHKKSGKTLKKINSGETLVGQAFLNQKSIYIEDAPRDFMKITSGLGEATPNSVIIIPTKINNEVLGVIELASFQKFKPFEIEFIEKLGESIAATLSTTISREKTQALLNNSQQMTEELKAQEEELIQSMEELSMTKAEIEKKNRETEKLVEKFELAIQTTTEGLWDLEVPDKLEDIGPDTHFWWSDNFRRMLGYESMEDFPNRLDSWSSLLHPDHQKQALNAFNKHLTDFSGNTPYDIEYQLLRKTGEYRWYRAVGNTLRDENGKPLRVAGSLIDIQESKDLAKVQKDLVEKFELAIKTTTEGLWDLEVPDTLEDIGPDTHFWWSDNFRRMLGYKSIEDFPNRLDSWSSLLHPDHQQQTLDAFNKHLMDFSGNTPYDVEYQLLRKTGEYRWYRAVGNTSRDENGKPLRVAGSLIDIQESKDLAKVQKDLVQKFELAIKTTTEGLWDLEVPDTLEDIGPETHFWWSDNFRRMLGYEGLEDFPNRLDSWSNLLHPDHQQQTLDAFNKHLMDFSGNTPYDVEYQLLRKTGEYRWYRAVGNTSRDVNGKPLRVAGSLIDIQESKDLAQVQKDLVQKFELAIKTTTEGLWDLEVPDMLEDIGPDTHFWWSDNFRRMLGYESMEDFPNRLDSWSNLLHPDHQQQTLDAFNKHLMDFSGNTPYDVEYQLLRKTGEYRWYRAVGNTLRDENGRPLRVAGSLIDIQESKDLAKVQKDLVEKYELAIKTTTEGLWDLEVPDTLEDIGPETHFWWSDNFRRMLGYESMEDFPNRLDSWSNLLHPDHQQQTLDAFNKHLMDFSGNTPYDVEYQLLRKTGEYRWYRAVGNTLRDENGKPLRVAGSLIDIEKQKELEAIRAKN